jgi:D-alanine-D-alanine ligase-like ATP-grasp enzyme
MKNRSVLILYDRADNHPVVAMNQSLAIECYSPETAAFIGRIVEGLGFSNILEDDLRHVMALAGSGFPTIFSAGVNLSTGLPTPFRAAQAATLFEMMRLPYTGSDPQVLLLCRDKAMTKRIAEAIGVAIPRGLVVTPRTIELLDDLDPEMGPVFVKPNAECSSLGIEENQFPSPHLSTPLVRSLLESFPEGVLVEQFIPGLELTVVAVGNFPDLELIPLVMRETDGMELPTNFVRTYKNKATNAQALQTAWFRADSYLPRDWVMALTSAARTLVLALKLRDFSRLDFRMRSDGQPFFIEANGQPSLTRGNSFSSRVNALFYENENQLEMNIIRKSFSRMGLLERTH